MTHETVINVVTLEGVKLNLTAGDTLAVMVPQVIHEEQRKNMMAAIKSALPEGVKVLIFDRGMTIAAISHG